MSVGLREKFQLLDGKLAEIRQEIETRDCELIQQVNARLDLDYQTSRLNAKRGQLLTLLYHAESIDIGRRTNKKASYYHKYDNGVLELVRYLVYKHTQLVYHNEFSLYAKFRYYHLFVDLKPVVVCCNYSTRRGRFSVFVLNSNTRLVYDKESNELVLANRRLETIKRVKIKESYSCFQILQLSGECFTVNLISRRYQKSRLYVFDFELKPMMGRRRVLNGISFVRSSQDKILCTRGDSLLIYDSKLDLIESLTINNNNKKHQESVAPRQTPFDYYIIHNCERFVSRCLASDSLIKIFSNKGSSLITEMPSGPLVKLFVDMDSNIYVVYKDNKTTTFRLVCFDYDGVFRFQQLDVFQTFDFFVKNGEQIYLFDANLQVKSIF